MSRNGFRSANYLLLILRLSSLSDIPSVTNIFRRFFLSTHASQPLQTWYSASVRGPTDSVSIPVRHYLLPVLLLSLFSGITLVTWQIFVTLCGGILSE